MRKQVFCSLQIEGIHYWKDCPLDEVNYLKHPHRHMFGITAFVDVSHNNRDVEFICLKHRIYDYLIKRYGQLGSGACYFGGKSCEMIAEELINKFNLSSCSVDEDGENGAILTKE